MTKLRVSEIFPSVQGEGIQTGIPMTFIRLAGCNLDCSWCDTKYANLNSTGKLRTAYSIVKEVRQYSLKWVCITGGEPLVQDITGLLGRLKFHNYMVTVETNGTIRPRKLNNESVDLWTASPKSGHWNFEALMTMDPLQLKIVVHEGMVLDIEKWRSVQPSEIVLQPCALTPFNVDRNRKLLRDLAEYVVKQGWNDVRVMPQLHKYMWGDKRGR